MKPRRSNIVVFFTDQQRSDTTGLHGNPMGLTPNFDRFAQEGTHFKNGFTCQPLCTPARAVMQTGVYPTVSGCFSNRHKLPTDSLTLAGLFNEAGYHTGYIGKWHLADENPVPAGKRGKYREWLAANALEMTTDAYHTVLHDNENQDVRLPGYRVDALTDAAIRFVDKHREKPFLLFLSFLEPHHQNHRDDHPAPDGYAERYQSRTPWMPPDLAALGGASHGQLAGYYGMVKRLDEAFGRFLDALKSLGLDSDTVVLFTSDHGCHFKTRNDQYKQSCHESSIRIPLAFGGADFRYGGPQPHLVSLIDIPPTLLDAAGIPVPGHWQGHSLLPLVRRAGDADRPEDVFVQISGTQVGRALRTRRWKYGIHAPDKSGGTDASSDRYEEQYLYDLKADPHELANLAGMQSHRQISDRLKHRLMERMAMAGEAPPLIADAPPRASGQRRVDDLDIHAQP